MSKAGTPVGRLGVWHEGGDVEVRVWAGGRSRVSLVQYDTDGGEVIAERELARGDDDVFTGRFPGSNGPFVYRFRVDGEGPFPDPFARAMPFGVHGASVCPADTFEWHDAGWKGRALDDYVIYEVHVGTATAEGTFEALIPRLKELRALGITALELLPLASTPGTRNWGYDGVGIYAPSEVYGGVEGLKRLVDAAHAADLAVVVDAVYNHLGPDGNYLRAYTPQYFTDRVKTPWGDALDLDGPHAPYVREFILQNVDMWVRDFHMDGLRLDATHELHDGSVPHILASIARRAKSVAPWRTVVVTAEDDRNATHLIKPMEKEGYGLDALWADDFHHQMRSAFAGDRDGYYADYTGSASDLARTIEHGWFYQGQPTVRSKTPRGTDPRVAEPQQFVHCLQNHDQVGNRAIGDRLGASVTPESFRAMSALLLLSPYTPLIFMGQEWNASTPFQYFTDHNAELGKLVTEGRRKEFEHFRSFAGETVPDPQAVETFERSRLKWDERDEPEHAGVLAWYRRLLALRANHPAFKARARDSYRVSPLGENGVEMVREGGGRTVRVRVAWKGTVEVPRGERVLARSDAREFGGEKSGDEDTAGALAVVTES